RRPSKMRCHGCSARILRDERVCFDCGRENILSCPCCQEPMLVEQHAGLLLDICRSCKGVWFDNAELEAIWLSDFDGSAHRQKDRGVLAFGMDNFAANVAGELLSETIFSMSSEVIKSTPSDVLDGAIDGSSAVLEAIISAIAEGIFGNL
ncbi:MAG: zf-TFIIB domain-containing protein, partial [Bradymonadaceae bacterium]